MVGNNARYTQKIEIVKKMCMAPRNVVENIRRRDQLRISYSQLATRKERSSKFQKWLTESFEYRYREKFDTF